MCFQNLEKFIEKEEFSLSEPACRLNVIVGKGGHTPLSKNPRCPHLS